MRSVCAAGLALALTLAANGRAGALDTGKDLTQYTRALWQAKDGLPPGRVAAIAQTRDGHLWIGTATDLVRFDGVAFRRPDARGPRRRPEVTALVARAAGGLWVGTRRGVRDPAGAAVVAPPAGADRRSHDVEALAEDARGRLWVATAADLFVHDGGVARAAGHPDVLSLHRDPGGRLWAGSRRGLAFLDGDRFVAESRVPPVPAAAIASGAGALWLGTEAGLLRLDEGGVSSFGTRQGLPSDRVTSVLVDRDGAVWAGTARGLARLAGGRVAAQGAGDGLPRGEVSALFEDREGSLWVGFEDGGLVQLTDRTLPTLPLPEGGGPHELLTACEDDEGAIWIGARAALLRWKDGALRVFERAGDRPLRTVRALAPDRGGVWVGTLDGLFRAGPDGVAPAAIAAAPFPHNVRALLAGRGGTLWIGTRFRGAARVQGDVVEWIDETTGLPEGHVSALAEDRDGSVWIGTQTAGVFRRRADGRVVAVEGLAGAAVRALHAAPDGVLWVGTQGGGLARVEDGRLVATLGAREELGEDTIAGIAPAGGGFIWIGSNRGIFRFSLGGAGAPIAFEASDRGGDLGLAGEGPAATRLGDGRLLFTTRRAAVVFDPGRVRTNATPPPVTIDAVIADGAPIEVGGEIGPGAETIEIRYAALAFLQPHKVRYRYRLEGLDRGWVEAGGRRAAYYTNLPPGRRRFHVIASNNDGVWNEAGATVELRLRPRYHQTPWFWGAGALAALGLALAAHRLRLARVRGAYRAVLDERVRVARELHDSLLQGLTAVALETEAALSALPLGSDQARARLATLQTLAAESLEEARRLVWDLRGQQGASGDLSVALGRTARRLGRTGVPIELRVHGAAVPLSPAAQNHLFKIAQEAITNALKHAGARRIAVELRYDPDAVRLTIADDGRGFDLEAAPPGGHFGLVGARERAAALGASFDVRSRPGAGTEVQLVLPRHG